jgi:TetR/AcrR family transcriptional regulator, regulator of cefoperazone and chloramphenicol sensitivity
MAQAPSADTRTRVLAAAASLFASKGFRGTTIREIATRAQVNVASGHYHFGSKKTLYLAVLRDQFSAVRRILGERIPARTRTAPRARARPRLEAELRARIQTMLDLQIGAHPVHHPALVQREMVDPTEAVPIIVREFITPLMAEMAELLAELAPRATPKAIERCCLSVVGQTYFYFLARPMLLQLWGQKAYPLSLTHDLAAHIATFSLGGLAAIDGARPRRARAAK